MTFLWRNTYAMVVASVIVARALGYSTDPFHQTTPSSTQHLVRRLITPASSSQSSTGLAPNGAVQPDPCAPMQLTAQTWVDLGIDDYIQNYPNADKLTIQQFAAELNVPNFFCGIGMPCSAGQLCHPAAGVNWLILYAIQEWNAYMNSYYSAIEDAINLMRDASADIVSDFIPRSQPQSGLYGWSVATVVVGILATFTGVLVPAMLPADAMQMVVDASKIGAGAGLIGGLTVPQIGRETENEKFLAQLEAMHAQANGEQPADIWSSHDAAAVGQLLNGRNRDVGQPGHPSPPPPNPQSSPAPPPAANGPAPSAPDVTPAPHLQKRALTPDELPKKRHPAPYAFTRWSRMASHLTVLQNDLQGMVSATAQIATLQPLTARGGIAEILSQGTFLYSNPAQTFMASHVKSLAQITALSEFFKSVKMFVTIGSDDCKYKGPNGAKNHPEDLSSCTKDGLMMNIVRAEGNKVVNKTPNARLLQSKYGYSVEYLANLAWDCQKKYGVQKPGETTYPPPSSIHSDCVFAIPVCDCTLPAVKHLRKKKKGTVKACRNGAGLPI
ncbi:hypothetical protein PCASD_15200 [Puccinia coronata f. sp. avenae]|uniref:DUF7872 domain-containing protein n=2 Tax=Puccinia coronata f. sp. avenae TaxID=200324 RepID=A0A2N5U0L6_9BASI|nr:hypothetical protein PCASD_25341 [Puccinia coronata f. sp. avenae]PLW31285.1 hypothetical protein PCASD_15200 [Puccinia coronata f. sp. avenae]